MKVLVVSNMYPNERKPYWGTFVKACVDGYIREGVVTDISVISDSGIKGYLKFYMATFLKLLFGRYDVVHVHYVTHSVAPVLFARIFRNFKIVLNFHGSDAFPEATEGKRRRAVKRRISNLAIKFSDLVVVPSEYFRLKMNASYDLNNAFVSPSGGVDVNLFEFSANGGKKVLFAGRMLHEKGPVIAANAVKACWVDLDAATFIGDGPEKQNVVDILSSLPITYFDLLPHAELAKNMALHDIFLFPSTREGESLGLVIIESIFSGMIPLVMDNGAVKDIIPKKYHELLIANSSKQFDLKLSRLLGMDMASRVAVATDLYEFSSYKFSRDSVSIKLLERVRLLISEVDYE